MALRSTEYCGIEFNEFWWHTLRASCNSGHLNRSISDIGLYACYFFIVRTEQTWSVAMKNFLPGTARWSENLNLFLGEGYEVVHVHVIPHCGHNATASSLFSIETEIFHRTELTLQLLALTSLRSITFIAIVNYGLASKWQRNRSLLAAKGESDRMPPVTSTKEQTRFAHHLFLFTFIFKRQQFYSDWSTWVALRSIASRIKFSILNFGSCTKSGRDLRMQSEYTNTHAHTNTNRLNHLYICLVCFRNVFENKPSAQEIWFDAWSRKRTHMQTSLHREFTFTVAGHDFLFALASNSSVVTGACRILSLPFSFALCFGR